MTYIIYLCIISFVLAALLFIFRLEFIILEGIEEIRSKKLTKLMKWFSFIGSVYAIMPFSIMIMLVLWKNNEFFALFIPFATFGTWIVNVLLKIIFKRKRPKMDALCFEKSYSYPSGHSMVNTTFYLVLSYFFYKTLNTYIYLYPATIMIFSIAFSRVYLAVHYPTDVLSGIGFGCICTFFVITAF